MTTTTLFALLAAWLVTGLLLALAFFQAGFGFEAVPPVDPEAGDARMREHDHSGTRTHDPALDARAA